MSEFKLLGRIRNISPDAAKALERADMRTDSHIRSLTREDLRDLLPGPGPEKFKLRRDIFEAIHRPVDAILKDLKGFIPHESLRAALSSNGVLVDYLLVLKDMKTQMNQVQGFLDAHIGLLEELSKEKPSEELDKDSSGRGRSDYSNPDVPSTRSTAGFSQGAQDSSRGQGRSDYSNPDRPLTRSTAGAQGNVRKSPDVRQDFEVRYQMLVSGKTHGADQQLMGKVLMIQAKDRVQFVESSADHQITILFCTNSSRIESNVEAAMSEVKDEKPVILVLMYHEREPKSTTPRIRVDSNQVVLHVNIFFHEAKNGLLTCQQNETAVTDIRQKLLEYSLPKCVGTSKNPPSVDAESGWTVGSGDNRVGGNNTSSCDKGGSSGSGFFSSYFRRQ